MSSGLPPRILIARGQFAEKAYSGRLKLSQLPRLRDALQGDEAEVQVLMDLHWDERWRGPVVRLQAALNLPLQCQRCMQAMQWKAQLDNHLLLVEAGKEIAEPDDMDIAQAQEGEVTTLSLIEDEILLALPLAPLHESDTACGRQGTESAEIQGKADNPFAVLAALKTKH